MDKTRLAEWMHQQGYTHLGLATKIGMSRDHVGRIARGRKPGKAFMWNFYRHFGRDLACDLFDDEVTA